MLVRARPQGKCWQFSTRSDDTTPVFLGGQKVVCPACITS
jgi:hypothetical protein